MPSFNNLVMRWDVQPHMSSSESRLLTIATTMTFTSYLAQFMRSPIIPLYARDIGVSLGDVGLISSAFMLVASTLAIPLGLISDRLGRRRLILLGVTLTTLASFLFPLAKSLILLFAVNALAGLGSAAYSPSMTAFVGDLSKGRSVGKNLRVYSTAMQVAMSLGPAVGGAARELASYEAVFTASGAIASIALLLGVLAIPKGQGVEESRRGWKLEVDAQIVSCWVATLGASYLWGVASSYLPLFGQDLGLNTFEIGLMFAAQSLSNALGRIPLGYLSEKIGSPCPLLLLGLGLGTVVTATVTLLSNLASFMGLMAGFGFAMGTVTLIATMTVSRGLPQRSRGIGMGVYYTSFYGGMALSPAIMGQVIASTDYQTGFGLTSLVGVVGIIVLTLVWMRSRRMEMGSLPRHPDEDN